MDHSDHDAQCSSTAAVTNADADLDVNQPLLTVTEQERGPPASHQFALPYSLTPTHSLLPMETGQAPQQQTPAQVDQTRPVEPNNHHGAQRAPPSDHLQGTIPLCHHADHDYAPFVEGTAFAALTAWHEQSCLQIWWLLCGTVMVILNAVSLALNMNSMNSYSRDQWRLARVMSVVVLSGYFGILSGQLYGMCLVCSVRLFTLHNKFAAPHCAGSIDLRSKVKACRVLGYVMFVFSAITGVLWLILGMLEHDISRHIGMFILGLCHACHATISLTVAIKANDVKRLLDPVSSGMITL